MTLAEAEGQAAQVLNFQALDSIITAHKHSHSNPNEYNSEESLVYNTIDIQAAYVVVFAVLLNVISLSFHRSSSSESPSPSISSKSSYCFAVCCMSSIAHYYTVSVLYLNITHDLLISLQFFHHVLVLVYNFILHSFIIMELIYDRVIIVS